MRKITLIGRTAADDYDVILESENIPEEAVQLEYAALVAFFKKNGIIGPYRQKSSGGGGGNRPGWIDFANNMLLINFPYKGSKQASLDYQNPILAKIKEISKQSPRGEKMKIGEKEEYVFAIGGGKVEIIKAILALPEFKDFERRKALQEFLQQKQ